MAKNTCTTCPPFPSDCFESELCSSNSGTGCGSDSRLACGKCIQPCLQTPRKREPEPCSGISWNNCDSGDCSPCGRCIQPCKQSETPCKRNPGPEAYDEFEACLNGSSFTMRVLKNGQGAGNLSDCSDDFNDENENTLKSDCSFTNIQRSNSGRNHKHHNGGHNISHPSIIKPCANTKNSSKDCHSDGFNVPYSKIKTFCENQRKQSENNRNHRTKMCNLHESDSICQPKHRKGDKVCCVQLDRQDTRNLMKGNNGNSNKKGVEVCYKTCEDANRDVFLLKLGTKHKGDHRKNNIEIELKTPKLPVTLPKEKPTRATQITETELDTVMSNSCKGKKGKGKKGKKGKKK